MNCPACGAPIADRQDWCLRCGNAARTRIERVPRWRLPAALASFLGLCLVAAVVLAIAGGLSGSAGSASAHTAGATGPSGASGASGVSGASGASGATAASGAS